MLRTENEKWKQLFGVLIFTDLNIISTVNGFEFKNWIQWPNNKNDSGTRKKLDSNTENCIWIKEPNML